MTGTATARPDAYALHTWTKYGHSDAAAVHAATRLGLLDHLAAAGGDVRAACARAGIDPGAGTVLVRILRLLGALRPGPAGPVGVLAPGTADALAAAERRAAAEWALLGAAADVLRAGPSADRDRLLDRLRVGPPPVAGPDETVLDCAAAGYRRARLLGLAAELGLLAALAPGPVAEGTLVAASGVDAAGLRPLLAALAGLGVLTDEPALTEVTRAALAATGRRGLETFVLGASLAHDFWAPLGRLDEVARTGRLGLDLHDGDLASRFYLRLARYTSLVLPAYLGLAQAVAGGLAGSVPERGSVLDVGAGSGVWGAGFARSLPGWEVEFLDRARVLAQTRANADRLGVADRAHFRVGDLAADRLGDGRADVLVLGQICHTQPAGTLPDLLARCRAALRPDGVLVLADMALDRDEAGPVDHIRFGVKELVSTGGAILRVDEYAALVTGAGLRRWALFRTQGLDVLLARVDGPLPDGLGPRLTKLEEGGR